MKCIRSFLRQVICLVVRMFQQNNANSDKFPLYRLLIIFPFHSTGIRLFQFHTLRTLRKMLMFALMQPTSHTIQY